jgi:hypothetical protein
MQISLAATSPFTPGSLVVARGGDGRHFNDTAAQPVFLDEFSTQGLLVQSIPLVSVLFCLLIQLFNCFVSLLFQLYVSFSLSQQHLVGRIDD